MQKLCPPSCLPKMDSDLDSWKTADLNRDGLIKWLDDPITLDEILASIKVSRKRSAAGLDSISPDVVAHHRNFISSN